jgi:hypothetical protein
MTVPMELQSLPLNTRTETTVSIADLNKSTVTYSSQNQDPQLRNYSVGCNEMFPSRDDNAKHTAWAV